MKRFTSKDMIFSVITGVTTGLCVMWILKFLNTPELLRRCSGPEFARSCSDGISWSFLIWFVPILWILGINLGYFLSRWFLFFGQFGKFVAVGFTNAAIDFAVLNLLISYTGTTSGPLFALYKAGSFLAAFVHSYFWNKFWVFETGKKHEDGEFGKFFLVTVVSIGVNVGATSIIVDGFGPLFGTDASVWANIGAIFGSAIALLFNFFAYRWIVFKK